MYFEMVLAQLKMEYWQMARHYCAESPIVQRKPTPEEIRSREDRSLLHRTMSCSVASSLAYTVQLDITLRVREIASGDRCTPQALLATLLTPLEDRDLQFRIWYDEYCGARQRR